MRYIGFYKSFTYDNPGNRFRVRIGQGLIVITFLSLLIVAGASAKGTVTMTHSGGGTIKQGGATPVKETGRGGGPVKTR